MAEQQPHDPVTDAIEEITNTLTGPAGPQGVPEQVAGPLAEGMPISMDTLAQAVNAEARRRYPQVVRQMGLSSLLTTVAPRVALRLETDYPYSFTEDDTMFPSGEETYGRVIRRSREDGIREIHGTLAEQDKEHMWLYIPDEGIWVDTTMQATGSAVECDNYLHIFLAARYSEVESVHTHLDRTARTLADTEPWTHSHNYLLEAAQPSSNDVIRHCQMVSRVPAGSRQVSSIISHYGITSFTLVENADQYGELLMRQYDRFAKDSSDPVAEIRALLERMSANVHHLDDSPAISIDFQPMQPE